MFKSTQSASNKSVPVRVPYQFFYTDWEKVPEFNNALRAFLGKAATAARTHFNGTITYSAGPWEEVDWQLFDIVGMDYYMDKLNKKEYVSKLRSFRQYGKPVVITEFGCCCYTGQRLPEQVVMK